MPDQAANNYSRHTERDEMHGRRAYVMYLFTIIFVLPWMVSVFSSALGYDLGGFSGTVVFDKEGNTIGHGIRFEFLEIWYITIPLLIYITFNRVRDAGLNPWLTIIFLLPVVNFIIWFWPPKKAT